MAPWASRIISSSERSGTPRSASNPPCESMRRAASPSRFFCAATRSQRRPGSCCSSTACASFCSLMVRPTRPGTGLLALRERLAVSRSDDVGAILRVVEAGRVGRLVTADAGARGDLELDECAGSILDVLAAGPVAVLALHVLAPDSAPAGPGAADLRAIDAADAAGLLPTGHVTLDAVQAELLLHRDQRLVGVGVPGLRPERGRVLVALGAAGYADEGALPRGRGWTRFRLALCFREVQLGHFLVVRIDQLLRIRVRAELLRERDECCLRPGGPGGGLWQGGGQERALALLQLPDLRLQLLAPLWGGGELQAEPLDAGIESLQLLIAVLGGGRERQGPVAQMQLEAQQ